MATNIELKAHYPDLHRARRLCDSLHATHAITESQLDTYFKVPNGRLKLRESSPTSSTLIYYEREDKQEPRQSDYLLVPVRGEPALLQDLLTHALGILVQVKKSREVFTYGNTRIHLDCVERLGTFIELEYVVDENFTVEDGKKALDALKQHFGIHEDDLIDVSYSDLLLRSTPDSSRQY